MSKMMAGDNFVSLSFCPNVVGGVGTQSLDLTFTNEKLTFHAGLNMLECKLHVLLSSQLLRNQA